MLELGLSVINTCQFTDNLKKNWILAYPAISSLADIGEFLAIIS
jgi:hypothetical protein